MKFSSRPGVAITISTPWRRSRSCGPARRRTPPCFDGGDEPKASHCSLICTASSRVGASSSAIGPSPGRRCGCATMCTTAGSTKPSVFPSPCSPARSVEPRQRERPRLAWIGVGAANPRPRAPRSRTRGTPPKNVRAGAGSARRPRGPPVTRTRCWWRQSRPRAAQGGDRVLVVEVLLEGRWRVRCVCADAAANFQCGGRKRNFQATSATPAKGSSPSRDPTLRSLGPPRRRTDSASRRQTTSRARCTMATE